MQVSDNSSKQIRKNEDTLEESKNYKELETSYYIVHL